MTVRITVLRQQGKCPPAPGREPLLAAGRPSIGGISRGRLGFGLIQGPPVPSTIQWVERFELPRGSTQLAVKPMTSWHTRPLEEELELSLLARGHPVAPRV